MTKSEMFMDEAIRICKETDYKKLYQSLNGGDGVYGKEVLEKFKEAHRRLLGDCPLPEKEGELVPFPAKITKVSDGRVWLGLCTGHVTPLPEDSFLFRLLHGHLIKTTNTLIPAEYKTVGHDPEDLFSDGGISVVVYSGDREMEERIEHGELEEDAPEENEEEEIQMSL